MKILAMLLVAVATGRTNPSQLTYTAPGALGSVSPVSFGQKLAERCSINDYTGPSTSAQITSATTSCLRLYFPSGTYTFSTTITMPTIVGRQWAGDGSQATRLIYTGTGPCGIVVDGSQSGSFEGMLIAVTNTAGATAPICFTDTTGSAQRWHFSDVALHGAQGNPPITGAYCLSMHSTTGSGIAYNWGVGLTTLNCDRGIEMLGDTGSGGVNGNWFFGYSSNANVSGVYFDGTSGDNYVQGHCNASGTTFAQVCAVIGDGSHTSSGNEVHLVADNGANGSVFNCQAGAVNSLIFAIKESGAAGVDTVACDSTNFFFSTSAVGTSSRNMFVPSLIVGSTANFSTDIFVGQSLATTSVTVKTNTNYTVGQHDRTISVVGLTAPHTVTLSAQAGRLITIGDGDGSITGTNTLTIAPPGGGGKINGSASSLVFTTPGKSADCSPLTANALNWSCRVSP